MTSSTHIREKKKLIKINLGNGWLTKYDQSIKMHTKRVLRLCKFNVLTNVNMILQLHTHKMCNRFEINKDSMYAL